MPYSAPKPCRHSMCKSVVRDGSGYCPEHLAARRALDDSRRGSSAERGYNARWRKARETYLRRNPLCVHCQELGRLTAATVVDHRVPHRGDSALFWDTDNWQALCKPCHDKWKQAQESADRRAGGGSKV